MILADANIWIDFFRAREPRLRALLDSDQVVMHPCLAAELSLGSLHNRPKTLAMLDLLPQLGVVSLAEVRRMIEARGLFSKGIGLTDAHLLASCLLTPGVTLWTRDAALANVARTVGVLANVP